MKTVQVHLIIWTTLVTHQPPWRKICWAFTPPSVPQILVVHLTSCLFQNLSKCNSIQISQTVALNHEIKLLQTLFLKLLPCSIFRTCIHHLDKMGQALGHSKTVLLPYDGCKTLLNKFKPFLSYLMLEGPHIKATALQFVNHDSKKRQLGSTGLIVTDGFNLSN